MKKSISNQILINTVGFEYFKECIKNGSTPEQAKAEMLAEEAQKVIAARIELVKLAEDHIIKLVDLNLIPLSTQLQRITGDPYCYQSFVNECDKDLNAKANSVIVHIKTGLKFLIP